MEGFRHGCRVEETSVSLHPGGLLSFFLPSFKPQKARKREREAGACLGFCFALPLPPRDRPIVETASVFSTAFFLFALRSNHTKLYMWMPSDLRVGPATLPLLDNKLAKHTRTSTHVLSLSVHALLLFLPGVLLSIALFLVLLLLLPLFIRLSRRGRTKKEITWCCKTKKLPKTKSSLYLRCGPRNLLLLYPLLPL